MAAKKHSASSAPKVATKKPAPKKAAKSAAAPEAKAAPAAPKAPAAKKAAAKKAAIKLTDKQRELLQSVASKGATGHEPDSPAQTRALEALKEKKVVKPLAKNKATGKTPFAITKAGEKALSSN